MVHGNVLNGLMTEMKQAPWTVSSVIALWLATLAGYSVVLPRLAQAGELKTATESLQRDLKATTNELRGFKASILLQRKQDQLRSLQQELFSLQREEQRLRAAGGPVPDLYGSQSDRLQQAISTTLRDIDAYMRAHPELVDM